MNGLKRYIRPGLVVSAIGHLGALVVGLLVVSANPFQVPRPEAMVVELVTPDEIPRIRGHAFDLAVIRFRDAITGQRQRPGHPSAARDPAQLAKLVIDIASGEVADEAVAPNTPPSTALVRITSPFPL